MDGVDVSYPEANGGEVGGSSRRGRYSARTCAVPPLEGYVTRFYFNLLVQGELLKDHGHGYGEMRIFLF